MSLESAVRARLTGNAAVLARAKTRVYHLSAPDRAEFPLIVFNLISETSVHAMSVDAGYREARVQVSAFAKTATEARELSDGAYTALSRFRGTAGGTVIQDVLADTASDQFIPEAEEGVYHRTRDFRVFFEG